MTTARERIAQGHKANDETREVKPPRGLAESWRHDPTMERAAELPDHLDHHCAHIKRVPVCTTSLDEEMPERIAPRIVVGGGPGQPAGGWRWHGQPSR